MLAGISAEPLQPCLAHHHQHVRVRLRLVCTGQCGGNNIFRVIASSIFVAIGMSFTIFVLLPVMLLLQFLLLQFLLLQFLLLQFLLLQFLLLQFLLLLLLPKSVALRERPLTVRR
jgi:hypothetical protein